MDDYCLLLSIVSSLSLLPLHRHCLSYFVFLFYQALHRVENFPLARRARGKKSSGSHKKIFWGGATSYGQTRVL